ncbi:MAG TPA: hypothetical protein PLT23_03115, partial [Lentisphaeria bacterium]|nr:hypothetical protein [Lentisphaeria bacterium]
MRTQKALRPLTSRLQWTSGMNAWRLILLVLWQCAKSCDERKQALTLPQIAQPCSPSIRVAMELTTSRLAKPLADTWQAQP